MDRLAAVKSCNDPVAVNQQVDIQTIPLCFHPVENVGAPQQKVVVLARFKCRVKDLARVSEAKGK